MQIGLRFSQFNENLFIKAIKVEEKMQNYTNIRSLLSALRDVPLERAWRMILEGALFEGRCGNKESARRIFRYLFKHCPNYGPIFLQASKYEEREGEIEKALEICVKGFACNLKYGPLWFQYLRLYEKNNFVAPESHPCDSLDSLIRLMFTHISKELNWKVCLEAAQTYEHISDYTSCANYLSNSLLNCPDNLRWKVWMIGSRIEYRFGNVRRSRSLVERCCQEVPSKQVSVALLDYAKFWEMEGNIQKARQIMHSAKQMVKAEWKLFFEAVMMEIRNGYFAEAERMVKHSLEIHFATGRLWATLI